MSEDTKTEVNSDPQGNEKTGSVHGTSSEGSGSVSREAKTPSEDEDKDDTGETESEPETERNILPLVDDSQSEESEPTPPEKEQEQQQQQVRNEPSHERYLDHQKARLGHDKQWWGEQHPEPPINHPDRQFMWAWNNPIPDEEFKDAVKGYNDHVINPETGEAHPFGVHIRPSTPPLERARKQVQGLKDAGQEVPTELVKEIIHHYTLNSGTFAALMEWSKDEKTIPIEVANEFVKMIDRLKLEMAKQLRDVHKMLDEANEGKDELNKSKDTLKKFLKTRDLEVARLENELRCGGEITHRRRKSDAEDQSISLKAPLLREIRDLRHKNDEAIKASSDRDLESKTAIEILKEKLEMAEVEVNILKTRLDHGKYASTNVLCRVTNTRAESQAAESAFSERMQFLESQAEVNRRCLEDAEKECNALRGGCELERKGREEAEGEIEKYKHFHQEIYKQLDMHAKTWALTEEAVDSLPSEDEKATEEARQMIREASKHWGQLKKNYETDWPPNKKSMEGGKLGRDWIVLKSLKMSEDALEASLERNFRNRDRFNQQLREIEDEKVKLEEAQKVPIPDSSSEEEEEEEKEFDESHAVPPDTGFQIPRTPVTDWVNSLGQDSLSPTAAKGWLDLEIQRLEQIKIDLGKDIAEKDEKVKQLERDIDAKGETQAEIMRLRDHVSNFSENIGEKNEEIEALEKALQACKDAEEANKKPGRSPEEERAPKPDNERTTELEAQLKTLEEEAEMSNNLKKQLHELRAQVKYLESEVVNNRDAITAMERVNYTTADSLVNAVRSFDSVDRLSLMDRINYLNLLCFFRTRNYIQLALRQGANTLANIMLTDTMKWVEFCSEDFKRMDPSVSGQIDASMRVLHGVRRIFTAKGQESMDEARRHVMAGRRRLTKLEHSAAFEQLVKLADNIIRTTQDTEGNALYGRTLRFKAHTGFRLERQMKTEKAQNILKGDAAMKAGALRTGFHSPFSPENWKNDLDTGFESE
ncbi:hypothetical protein ACHAP5_007821 [Fusarium lateritium]